MTRRLSRGASRGLQLCTAGLAALAATGAWTAAAETPTPDLPGGLVYLRQIDPTILQDMKYATADNFTGRIVPGYTAGECILLRPAAEALAKVQADLRPLGLSLKVYDCFRPRRAVRAFMSWSDGVPAIDGTKRFHPRTARSSLVASGYIARTSAHSRGTAVDLTLVPAPPPDQSSFDPNAAYGACNGPASGRAPDNSLDMGTGFDCFDAMSATYSGGLSTEQKGSRSKLVTAMARRGFQNYAREWWHFTFDVRDAKRSFDFEIGPAAEVSPSGKAERK